MRDQATSLDDLADRREVAYERWLAGGANATAANPLWQDYIDAVADYETAYEDAHPEQFAAAVTP